MADDSQETKIPFIGDLFNYKTELFEKTCVTGSLAATEINIQNNTFEIEIGLSSNIDEKIIDNQNPDLHIVVGINIRFGSEDEKKTGCFSADIIKDQDDEENDDNMVIKTWNVPTDLIIGGIQIVTYKFIPVEFLKIFNDLKSGSKLNPRKLENISAVRNCNGLIDAYERFKEHDLFVLAPIIKKQEMEDKVKDLGKTKMKFLMEVYNILQGFNSANWLKKIGLLDDFIRNFSEEIKKIKNELKGNEGFVQKKSEFVRKYFEANMEYVIDIVQFNEWVKCKQCYVYFLSEEFDQNEAEEAFQFYKNFIAYALSSRRENDNEVKYYALDIDSFPKNEMKIVLSKKSVIRYYDNSVCKIQDLIKELSNQSKFNLAKGTNREKDRLEPKERAQLKIPCPNSFDGSCSDEIRDWVCEECNGSIEYGFNDYLYCNCDPAHMRNFGFKCSDFKHGQEFVKLTTESGNHLRRLTPRKNVNVLILGQSGIGKSTWINSVVNYLLFDDIEDAKTNRLIIPIPLVVPIYDKNLHCKNIIIGEDEDEVKNVGESATQECKTYTVKYEDYSIKLIDTPGLGDSRGIDQDKENVKKILDYIKYTDSLHCIMILLKCNERNIGTLLQYCVKEIMCNLHKNCSRNIVYCFSHARASFYTPGETKPVLCELLRNIDVDDRLSEDKIYCFENESLHYLYARKHGSYYTKKEEEGFVQSWNKGVSETKRLFEYVVQLPPHDTHQSLSLNNARRIIMSLTKPALDIAHNIAMNVRAVQNHKKYLEGLALDDHKLMKSLFVPQIVLENVPLGYPRTVCTAERCVRVHSLPQSNLKSTEYIRHCHPHCYLKGVTPENYPNRDLLGCAAMQGTKNCVGCGCSWETHMHILYDQKRTEIQVRDRRYDADKKTNEDKKRQKEAVIRDLEKRIADLEWEKDKIIAIAGRFAKFLTDNAISAYNDCFEDYLDFLINEQESKRFKSENEIAILDNLKRTKKKYLEEIKFFKEVSNSARGGKSCDPKDVQNWVEELYALPINGKILKDNVKVAMDAEDSAARFNQKKSYTGFMKTMKPGFITKIQEEYKSWQNKKGGDWKQQGRNRGKGKNRNNNNNYRRKHN